VNLQSNGRAVGILIRAENEAVLTQRFTVPDTGIQIQDPGSLDNPEFAGDAGVGLPVSGGQDDSCPHRLAMLGTARTRRSLQDLPVRRGQRDQKWAGHGHRLTHFKIDYRGGTVSGRMVAMASPPESTKTSLRQRLQARARDRWPPTGQCCHAPLRRVRLRC